MLKLVKFVNERGGNAVIPGLSKPPTEFKNLENVFQLLLKLPISKNVEMHIYRCRFQNKLKWIITTKRENSSRNPDDNSLK